MSQQAQSSDQGDRGLPSAVVDQAAAWQVLLLSGQASTDDRAAAEQWRQAHPDHTLAWERMGDLLNSMRQLTENTDSDVALSALQGGERISRSRRRTLKGLAALGAIGLATWFAREQPAVRQYLADHRTGVGERRLVMLEDGSRLLLNTATALDVHTDGDRRRLLLHGGEIQVITASGSRLTVTTADGSAEPAGTRFTVRRYPDQTRTLVQVESGQVLIRPRKSSPVSRITAGHQARFDAAGVTAAEPADATATAWTQGMLIAERRPLGDLVRELARHRHGITRCAPAVAGLRVTGTFPLAAPDRVLDALAHTLPVRVRRITQLWAEVIPA